MSKLPSLGFIAGLALIFCPGVAAQKMQAVAAAPAPHASVAVVHPHHVSSSSSRQSHPVASRRSNISSTTTGNPNEPTSDSNPRAILFSADSGVTAADLTGSAPGLGFDYEHLAAVSGNLGVEALIDPVTQANLALESRLQRNSGFGGGAYILGGYGGYPADYEEQPQAELPPADAPSAPQPQVIIIQQPVPATMAATAPAQAAAAEEAEPQSEPIPPLTLVLKNGSRIEAVAFTRQKDKIVYISRAGVRGTVATADVDAAATTKLNDDRGTPLNLSL
jgi:hypothetical protein